MVFGPGGSVKPVVAVACGELRMTPLENRIFDQLSRAMKSANEEDDWHRYGEGYGTLRIAVTNIIYDLKTIKEKEESDGINFDSSGGSER